MLKISSEMFVKWKEKEVFSIYPLFCRGKLGLEKVRLVYNTKLTGVIENLLKQIDTMTSDYDWILALSNISAGTGK